MSTFTNILMATDLSEASETAGHVAASLAREQNASLTFLHVYILPAMVYGAYPMLLSAAPGPELQQAAEKGLERWMQSIHPPAQRKAFVRAGEPADAILEEIRDAGADLLVVGTHGRRGVSRVLLGSTAEKLVRLSPIAVLTVKHTPVSPEISPR